jgi:hypothetical protein
MSLRTPQTRRQKRRGELQIRSAWPCSIFLEAKLIDPSSSSFDLHQRDVVSGEAGKQISQTVAAAVNRNNDTH